MIGYKAAFIGRYWIDQSVIHVILTIFFFVGITLLVTPTRRFISLPVVGKQN
ncbi:hypothetical protein H9L19_04425 [Weissella diestrammenae]|uniref:Uncharacterized protein n=1 Tax=Weissella diestrammenae TaxID=1162633 RepID=A0A7G9T3K4_9LACO|nr:hypothetical protein [Weissella diestrammenae]MCM0582650.1 hypothetical protein [Weissella diestrammenae]QNN74679.1 hypothetical protein H9L19_04425 [Weissella diestrammenae]